MRRLHLLLFAAVVCLLLQVASPKKLCDDDHSCDESSAAPARAIHDGRAKPKSSTSSFLRALLLALTGSAEDSEYSNPRKHRPHPHLRSSGKSTEECADENDDDNSTRPLHQPRFRNPPSFSHQSSRHGSRPRNDDDLSSRSEDAPKVTKAPMQGKGAGGDMKATIENIAADNKGTPNVGDVSCKFMFEPLYPEPKKKSYSGCQQ